MDLSTKILHTKVSIEGAGPVVTPLFQNSAFEASSPHFYTRKQNPNSLELENVISNLEESKHALTCTTGMTAISLALSLVPKDGCIVLNKLGYGCSVKLFQRACKRMNIELLVIDLTEANEVELLPSNVSMVFFETPTNPFLKSISIKEISNKIKSKNSEAIVVVDNTWATPFFQKPLEWGADLVVYSATKFFSGHSDVMGGFCTTNDPILYDALLQERFYSGAILDPHSAWLLRRSMQTFVLRMKDHQQSTIEMKSFLESEPAIKTVYYPDVDGEQLQGYGGILFFEFAQSHVGKYESFRDSLTLFSSGTGMACVTSMVAQPYSGSHASLCESEKEEMGIDQNLVRLCFGHENLDDLKNDIQAALEVS